MLDQRLRRWSNIKSALGQYLLFAGLHLVIADKPVSHTLEKVTNMACGCHKSILKITTVQFIHRYKLDKNLPLEFIFRFP